jgi:hypothetical protein
MDAEGKIVAIAAGTNSAATGQISRPVTVIVIDLFGLAITTSPVVSVDSNCTAVTSLNPNPFMTSVSPHSAVAADKGYRSSDVMRDLAEWKLRSYIADPERGAELERQAAEQAAVYANRRPERVASVCRRVEANPWSATSRINSTPEGLYLSSELRPISGGEQRVRGRRQVLL